MTTYRIPLPGDFEQAEAIAQALALADYRLVWRPGEAAGEMTFITDKPAAEVERAVQNSQP
jgi:hypothetical protein